MDYWNAADKNRSVQPLRNVITDEATQTERQFARRSKHADQLDLLRKQNKDTSTYRDEENQNDQSVAISITEKNVPWTANNPSKKGKI